MKPGTRWAPDTSSRTIAFGMGALPIARGARLRAAFQVGVDSYFGAERVQLRIKDVKT